MDVLADLLGQAPSIAAIREQIRQILARISQARRLPPILIEGETGTGKNLVASVIHRAGPRAGHPFVDVNCAAIPDGLLEAELFGFERGAFTDARQSKAGLFQAASGGTIFLDEIALLSDALQAKLLKIIEDRTLRRLGSTASEPVDVLIIAATNDDLDAAVRARRFRADLYHRLAVLTLRLPPLRERPDDIAVLADYFLARACRDYALPSRILSPAARAALREYGWPGNVRELANVIERVALLIETASITPAALALSGADPPDRRATVAPGPPEAPLDTRVESWERQELLRALDACGWKVVRAAARLGITRGTIRYRIQKYGLAPPTRRVRKPPPRPAPGAPWLRSVTSPTVTRWEPRLVALLQATTGELGRDLEVLVQKIESFAGRVEEASPARIVAAFGLDPVEDATRRAALAALAIQTALARSRRSGPDRLAVTIAVHTEQCPVAQVSGRAHIDGDARRQMAEVLDALSRNAEPGTIMVSRAARPLLGPRFDVHEPDQDDQPEAFGRRLLAHHPHRFGLGGDPGPFVGREAELNALRAQWQQARLGRGQLVAVVGEPGIGKSRLVFEFCRALGGEPRTHLEGRAESYGGGIPYRPVVELLKAHLGVDERDEPQVTAASATARLLALDAALAPDVAPILALLNAPVADPEWNGLEPAHRRQRTLDALKRLVLRMSQERPVLLVVEDLHWIDAETQAFLDRLVLGLPAARVLVVVSYRPEYRHGWSGATSSTQLHLEPLPSSGAEELVNGIVGPAATLEPLRRLLIEKTEGNPFFLEESVRTLVETRVLLGRRGAYRAARAVESLEVPETVRAVLAARVDRLPPDDKQALYAAAVVGKDVPFGLLRGVADLPEAALRGSLANLQVGEFLREAHLVPEVVYSFKHALTHEVAYAALALDLRRALHARMVDVLERVYADRLSEHVERLAHHAHAAELWPKAQLYARRAGAKAAWRSAHREAVPYFDQALRAIRRLPETRAILEETLDLYLQLRWSFVPLGEYARLTATLRDAEALAERLGDQHRLGEMANSLTNFLRVVGDCDGALAAGQRARAIGAALGERSLELRAAFQLAMVRRQIGDYRRAIGGFGEVVEGLRGDLLYERFGEPSVLSVHARLWLAVALAEVGEFDQAITTGEEAIRIAATAQNAYSETNAHIGLGTVYLRRGDPDDAIPLLERGVSLCRDGNFNLLLPSAVSALGAALTLAGRAGDGVSLLECAVETALSRGLIGSFALYLARLGHSRLLTGQAREAGELATRALETARKHKERGHEAWALLLLGEVAAARRPLDVAAVGERYAEALALGEALEMRPMVAQCHWELGAFDRTLGRHSRARDAVVRAATMFRELGMRRWLARTEAELARATRED